MKKRLVIPIVFGVIGTATLLWLGLWQVQRLAWKEAILADISARIVADPVTLPANPDPEADRYLPVKATGELTGEEVIVLASVKQIGAVHRLMSVLETEGRRVLVDRGYVPIELNPAPQTGPLEVLGNLHWPQEVDSFTPKPDLATGLWFARDVPAMAKLLKTEPILIVARQVSAYSPPVTPLPVTAQGIPNDHLSYAITWFLLALVWSGMTVFLVWRIRQRND